MIPGYSWAQAGSSGLWHILERTGGNRTGCGYILRAEGLDPKPLQRGGGDRVDLVGLCCSKCAALIQIMDLEDNIRTVFRARPFG
jgi:hypothetical protein